MCTKSRTPPLFPDSHQSGGPALTVGVPLVLARDAVATLDCCGLPTDALQDFAELAIHVAERDS